MRVSHLCPDRANETVGSAITAIALQHGLEPVGTDSRRSTAATSVPDLTDAQLSGPMRSGVADREVVALVGARSLLLRLLGDQGVELLAEVLSPSESSSLDERQEATNLGDIDRPDREEPSRIDAILQPGVAHR